MTAMFGIRSMDLPHVDVYRWAAKHKIFLPANFRKTPEQEAMYLKMLCMKKYFIKLSPLEHEARVAEALEEEMEYYPEGGLSDRAVALLQIVTTLFFAIFYLIDLASSSKI
jgi:hypothetical protein